MKPRWRDSGTGTKIGNDLVDREMNNVSCCLQCLGYMEINFPAPRPWQFHVRHVTRKQTPAEGCLLVGKKSGTDSEFATPRGTFNGLV